MWMMINANGYTLSEETPTFSEIAIADGRIVAVGGKGDRRLYHRGSGRFCLGSWTSHICSTVLLPYAST